MGGQGHGLGQPRRLRVPPVYGPYAPDRGHLREARGNGHRGRRTGHHRRTGIRVRLLKIVLSYIVKGIHPVGKDGCFLFYACRIKNSMI